jgi:hypothetical protein
MQRSNDVIIEPVELSRIRSKSWLETLSRLEVGESVFVSDPRDAESIRVSSYYLLKSRNLDWKFISRKMDRGWRLIRVA